MAIASACGLRAFLPLLVLGLAARAGLVPLASHGGWLASAPVLWSLAVAALVEMLGDKIPVLDHALDALGTIVRPLAATAAAWAAFGDLPGPLAVAISLVLGAGAFGAHLIKAKTRLGSSVLTMGIANPFLSVIEDAGALLLSALAVLLPLLGGITALVLVALAIRGRRAQPGGP